MNTSLRIEPSMNLAELADRMGGATEDEARKMRALLIHHNYEFYHTEDVPDADWLTMLDKVVELAARPE